MNKLFCAALLAALIPALPAVAGVTSTSRVEEFPGVGHPPGQDAESTLVRSRDGLELHVRTSGLDPESPYTVWAVIFDQPRHCLSLPCSDHDLAISPMADPRADASIVFAGGGMSDLNGRARFLGRVRQAHGRVLEEVVLGTGSLDPRRAEVHVVIRGHGYPAADELFDALHSFGGGCSESNACEDQQFAVHLP